jgi:hypothetical protein
MIDKRSAKYIQQTMTAGGFINIATSIFFPVLL